MASSIELNTVLFVPRSFAGDIARSSAVRESIDMSVRVVLDVSKSRRERDLSIARKLPPVLNKIYISRGNSFLSVKIQK